MVVAGELEAVGADAGYVGVPDLSSLSVEVARVTPYCARPVRLAFPASAPYPLAETLRTGSPLYIGSNEQLACEHPGLTRLVVEDHACATLPLLDPGGAVVGALNVSFEDPHVFADHERAAIVALARRCAQALHAS
jgi:GAF domain-containing protein